MKKQSGVALITALLVVAIAVVAAAAMFQREYFNVRQTSNIMQSDQSYFYSLAAESWAMTMLAEDINNSNGKLVDDAEEADKRAEGLETPIDNGSLSGKMFDLQGRFNLNNLIKYDQSSGKYVKSELDFAIFKRLVEIINDNPKEDDPYKEILIPIDLPHKILDWIDSDMDTTSDNTGSGAEDDVYSSQEPAYVAPNGRIASISELMLVDGIYDEVNKDAIFRRLEPYITALPERTAINVNIASAELIAALIDDMRFSDAETLVGELKTDPVDDVAGFIESYKGFFKSGKVDKEKNKAIDKLSTDKVIGVSTDYFYLQVETEFADSKSRLHSLIYRSSKKGLVVVARGNGCL